jgi:hypothetical protein
MRNILLIFIWLTSISVYAQESDINNFLVKENLLKNNKLAIIAADSLENPIEKINGNYTFIISGFTQILNWLTALKCLYELNIKPISLFQIKDWCITENSIHNKEFKSLIIIILIDEYK